MIIVQFYDSRYGVRRGNLKWFGKNSFEYLSNTTNKWLPFNMADGYCKVDTYDDAMLLMKRYEQSLTPDYGVGVGLWANVDYDR